jgi:hypothetical protein
MDDDGNSLDMIVIEELALPTIVGFRGSVTSKGNIVLPGRPTPLNEEHITLREPSIIVLDTRIGLIIAALLHLNHSVTPALHLVNEINTTTTVMIRCCGYGLLLERGYKPPE